jgi:phosphate/sulfate permease
MELTGAIALVLAIYVGIPVALTCAIGGVYAWGKRLAARAERAATFAEEPEEAKA